MMTYQEALQVGKKLLQEAGVQEFEQDAWYLLSFVAKIDRSFFYLHQNDELTEEVKTEYKALLGKRRERIPLQYLTGEQEFMGLNFKVNSAVLIPRQDTEVLVEETEKLLKDQDEVLDLCTGSGCIIISLVKAKPEIKAFASDQSKQALIVARENAKNNQVSVEFLKSDLYENIHQSFDVIVSNPPYIPTEVIHGLEPEVRDFEPEEALDGGPDGLEFYRSIIAGAAEHLKPEGHLLMEIGYDQAPAVVELLEEHKFQHISVVRDLAGKDRVVKACYTGEP